MKKRKNWRFNFIIVIFLLGGAAIISRLIIIQFIHRDYYKAMAQGQQHYFQALKGERGEIFFRGGQVLATNINRYYLFLSPNRIKDKVKTAEKLAEITGLNKSFLLEKAKKEDSFERVKDNISKKEEEKILSEKLPGVYLRKEIVRSYPQKGMASHIIGFLSKDGNGQYGIEEYYNNFLQGKEKIYKDSREINSLKAKGDDIYLTIDYNIQFIAEKLLRQAKERFKNKSGQIIVINPNNGQILALADYPNFDPNNYSAVKNLSLFQNSAIQKLFEPGSIFKAITIAAALDQNKITPETTYFDTGQDKIGGYIIHNYDQRSFGRQTMTNVLEKSINTGAVFAERKLGNNLFLSYLKNFDFFKPTKIDFPGEIFSENNNFKKGYEINFATAAFGQGIEVTPMQMVKAYSALANGGYLIQPYLSEKALENGRWVNLAPKEPLRRVISEKTASEITAMLVSVVKNGPYTQEARVPGYYIAGKTGTSQVPWTSLGISRRGYSNETWQSFIGFAPAFNPRFLIMVKLDNPNTTSSEYSAVPIFQEMAKYIINYYQIPPDYGK